MSKIAVNEITNEAGTGGPTLPNGLTGGLTLGGDLDIGSSKITNGGTGGIEVDTAGRVTNSTLPAFRVFRDSPNEDSSSETDLVPYNAKDYDVGNNYDLSTLRFNAPVSGTYFFTSSVNCYAISSGTYFYCALRLNGSNYAVGSRIDVNDTGDFVVVISEVLSLSEGDYVEIVSISGDASRSYSGSGTGFWNHFAGYLIG